ncbi:MAG: ATP-binding protein [Sulfuricellaceae bacterium]
MHKHFQPATTILVVEDEPGDYGLIRALVRLAGLGSRDGEEPAIWVQTLADGINEAKRKLPDVVLLDLSLPDSSGVATVQKMRAAFADVPIVVLTGHDDDALAVASLEAGAQDYLVKGQFDVDALNRAVRNAQVRGALESRLRLLNETLEQRVQAELAINRAKDLKLIQQSRQVAMGEMVHNIAHQWRQPLNALALILANIQDDYRFGELNEATLARAVAGGNRVIQKMSHAIDDLRNFFQSSPERRPFKIGEAVHGAIALVDAGFREQDIECRMEGKDDIETMGYENELAQVLLNLFNNSKDAIKSSGVQHGCITVRLAQGDDTASIMVRDNGGGIPDAVMERIFDPYFSTKEAGTGIGLYMSRMIVEKSMGGRIAAANVADGAEFTVSFPLLKV